MSGSGSAPHADCTQRADDIRIRDTPRFDSRHDDVVDREKPLQATIAIDDRQASDAGRRHDAEGIFHLIVWTARYEPGRHRFVHRDLRGAAPPSGRRHAQIPVGHDAHEHAPQAEDWQNATSVLLHQGAGVGGARIQRAGAGRLAHYFFYFHDDLLVDGGLSRPVGCKSRTGVKVLQGSVRGERWAARARIFAVDREISASALKASGVAERESAQTQRVSMGTVVAPLPHGLHPMTTTLVDKQCSFDLVAVIRAEYLEMPGLCLTLAQAARLWNVDQRSCRDALESLIRRGFLCRSGDSYIRACGRC